MKTIGLLGGMSWESTSSYYKKINEGIKLELGGLHSAKVILYSVDFDAIQKLQRAGEWGEMASILSDAAGRLQSAGADCLLICTNTMHKVAGEVEHAIDIPLLHIADATARQLVKDNISKVGLLGTAFTMEQEFYKGRLQDGFGLEVVVPEAADRQIVHDVIFRELCLGKTEDASRAEYLRIVASLAEQGAQAVILGCTEIGLLITQGDTPVPLYDTTDIHAASAVAFALGQA